MTLFAVGRILKSVGIKGFVKIEPLTHTRRRFDHLKEVYVGMDDSSAHHMVVGDVKDTPKGILLKFHTIDDRTSSDKLINHYVFVDEVDLLPPPRGSYFIHDIIGCIVWMNNKPIGTVVDVYLQSQGLAQDIWIVESTHDDEQKPRQYWLPVVKEFIEDVDIPHRKIVVRDVEELEQW